MCTGQEVCAAVRSVIHLRRGFKVQYGHRDTKLVHLACSKGVFVGLSCLIVSRSNVSSIQGSQLFPDTLHFDNSAVCEPTLKPGDKYSWLCEGSLYFSRHTLVLTVHPIHRAPASPTSLFCSCSVSLPPGCSHLVRSAWAPSPEKRSCKNSGDF